MKIKCFFHISIPMLCLLSFTCHAQTYVLDSQDNSPIEDVRVSYGENEVVNYTDPQGMLDTTTSECLKLFHPAYYTKVACNADTVYLDKRTQLISEVVVTDKPVCEWAIEKGQESKISIGTQPGDMQGVAVGGENFKAQRIGHVRFKLKENLSSDLRVRFHLVNPTDTGNVMVNPIASTTKTFKVGNKKGWIDFDLTTEHLVLPDYHVALMIEFISDSEGIIITLDTFGEPAYDSFYLRRGLVFKSWRNWAKEYQKLVLDHQVTYVAPAIMVEVCK